jgi:putative addiction module component (TIGR02574 family)
MDQDIATLIRDALDLSAEARIELVDALLASLDAPDAAIDQAWADEGEKRLDQYLAGGAGSQLASDVVSKHLKP